ncbi:hypothetical protein R3Q06_18480 [Rhodococcus erythropolis]|uniref:hypothetical protein n=1 Tax=Rhodococcus erythropolis TaxID=1833 RepID=UPI002948E85D|nr:hypothetical protein [Rhodococcus erythropolis]MDV6275486.1 hypothetical protein [Rhodococcus erythropolis]
MLVVTLVLAGVGFALLIVALTTGSLIWAWACIAICVAGAVLLLVSALTSRKAVPSLDDPVSSNGMSSPYGRAESSSDSSTGDAAAANDDNPGNHGESSGGMS